MSDLQKSTGTVEARQKQNGSWTAGIFFLVGLAFFLYDLNVVVSTQQGQFHLKDMFLMPATVIMMLAATLGFFLIRRGRYSSGTNLLHYSIVVFPPVWLVLFLIGIAPIAILYAVSLSFLMIGWILPKASRRSALIATVISIIAIPVIDLWNPGFRESTRLGTFANAATALTGLLIAYILIRRALASNIFIKLMVAIVIIIILSVAVLGSVNVRSYRLGLTENVGNSMTKLSEANGRQIATTLDREMTALTTLSLSKTIQSAARAGNQTSNQLTQEQIDALDQQWQAANAANDNLDPLVSSVLHSPVSDDLRSFRTQYGQHAELFVTGQQGVIVSTTNRTSDYYQADEEWWQVANRDGKYIGQPEYDESSGITAINMAVAIREFGDGRILGILRTTVNLSSLSDTLGAGVIGETGRTVILLPDGRQMTLEKTEAGMDQMVVTDAPPELITLSQSVSGAQDISLGGVSVLAGIADVKAVTLNEQDAQLISNLNWRVATIQESAEAMQALANQTRNGLLLSVLVVLLGVVAAFIISRLIANPITRLNSVAQKILEGDLDAQAKVETQDEVGTLATTFNSMTRQLRDFIASLESRVAERTQSLELAADVGRSVSQVRALDVMLKDAAEIIRSRFDLYYVQVYLTNQAQNTLLLQSGTGLVGAELIGRGHKLPLDTGSINGLAAVEKHTVVISDTAASTTFRPNPLLPDTRSEMAVPLLVGNKIVGVLDLQSRQPGALNKELLPAFEALAGQLAIAIQNAQLLAEADQARAEVERQARRLVRDNWEDYLDAVHLPEKTGFVFEKNVVKPLDEMVETEMPAEGSALVSPIAVTGEQLGTLVVETTDQSPQNAELVRIVARQVAQQIENLRLLDSADRYRSEAEAASRRSTIEGWRQYIGSTSGKKLGYLYDSSTVRPDDVDHRLYEAGLTLPIKIREETVGNLSLMGVESKDNESFELASAVADRLGAHIETLRLIEETRKSQVELDNRARQLAAVAAISTVSSREMDINKMLHSVVQLTQRQFDLYHTHIFLFNEAASELKIAACGWKEGDLHEGTDDTAVIPLDREQSLVARAARTRQAVIVNNVRSEPDWLQNPLHPETESEMAVPLLIGDQLLGILDVQSDRPDAFTEEDANIQTTLAAQVATSLQNARSYTQAQQQAQREAMLNAISQKIQGATSVEAVLQIAARELGHALGAPLTIAQLGVKDGNK